MDFLSNSAELILHSKVIYTISYIYYFKVLQHTDNNLYSILKLVMYLETDECKISVSKATLDNYIHIKGIV